MIGLICDTHWGVRNDVHAILDHQKQFLDETFLPYLYENGIKEVIHGGDLVDRRKYTNHYTAHRLRVDFLAPLKEMGVKLHIIAGNHDTHFKNTNEVNAFQMLGLDREDWVHTYTDPTLIQVQGLPILLMPWICDDNAERSARELEESPAEVCIGHFDIQGFERAKGNVNDTGIPIEAFKRFKLVLSGHYHAKQTSGNITYLGAPWEATWGDYGVQRGFHTLDPKSLSLTFLRNPRGLFHMIEYDDATQSLPEVLPIYKNGWIKLIVKSKTQPEELDRLIHNLESLPVTDVQIVDETLLSTQIRQQGIDQSESTLDILRKTVDELDIPNRNPVKDLLSTLYHEAHLVQS